jgi:hypothetical protein
MDWEPARKTRQTETAKKQIRIWLDWPRHCVTAYMRSAHTCAQIAALVALPRKRPLLISALLTFFGKGGKLVNEEGGEARQREGDRMRQAIGDIRQADLAEQVTQGQRH